MRQTTDAERNRMRQQLINSNIINTTAKENAEQVKPESNVVFWCISLNAIVWCDVVASDSDKRNACAVRLKSIRYG